MRRSMSTPCSTFGLDHFIQLLGHTKHLAGAGSCTGSRRRQQILCYTSSICLAILSNPQPTAGSSDMGSQQRSCHSCQALPTKEAAKHN